MLLHRAFLPVQATMGFGPEDLEVALSSWPPGIENHLNVINLNCVPGAIRGKSKGAIFSPQQPKMVMMFPIVFHLPVLPSTPEDGQPFHLSHIPPPKVQSKSVRPPVGVPSLGSSLPLFSQFPSTPFEEYEER